MAADIVPDLYKEIQSEFEQNIAGSSLIRSFQGGNKHDAREVSLYAAEVGRCASRALSSCLTEERLPGGKLYWNIANRTIYPLLREAYRMVMEAAEAMQGQQDEALGIRVTPVRPEFPEERVDGLIAKLIEYQGEEDGE